MTPTHTPCQHTHPLHNSEVEVGESLEVRIDDDGTPRLVAKGYPLRTGQMVYMLVCVFRCAVISCTHPHPHSGATHTSKE